MFFLQCKDAGNVVDGKTIELSYFSFKIFANCFEMKDVSSSCVVTYYKVFQATPQRL